MQELFDLRISRWRNVWAAVCLAIVCSSASANAADLIEKNLRRYCFDCHTGEQAKAGIDLEKLTASPKISNGFRTWRKVAEQIERNQMPPADALQPSDEERQSIVSTVRRNVHLVAKLYADEPGETTIRRLTSAEYGYTIQDLIGFDIDVARDFAGDAVGGEGFTNVGTAQFVQDSTLEQYLTAAKRVADHAVIGTGPLTFFRDPGKTGFELSAINRIQQIYRQHGFRTAAGEGGEPYGLDRYSRAFYVAWQFEHREKLNSSNATLASLAEKEGIDAQFARHIWQVLTSKSRTFPLSEIAKKWRALPEPGEDVKDVRELCADIQRTLYEWQRRFGENPDAKEEARILAIDVFNVSESKLLEMNVNWPKGTKKAHLTLSVESADGADVSNAVVVWQDADIYFRIPDKVRKAPRPLKERLSKETQQKLSFGKSETRKNLGPKDFVTVGDKLPLIELPIIEGARSARITVTAKLVTQRDVSRVIRCSIAQREETDQGKSVSALLANTRHPSFHFWRAGVLDFAKRLPQISHREPAPSDRDPIPHPFDRKYNNPERNKFHARIKYYRDDQFLMDNILDSQVARQLDRAWTDLLGSFDYHDEYLKMVADKYDVDLGGRTIANMDPKWLSKMPQEPRNFASQLYLDFHAMRKEFERAEAGHLDDSLRFAEKAWRRPLDKNEQDELRQFYHRLRDEAKLEHVVAVRALIARILMAPSFLYRTETPAKDDDRKVVELSNWELASRLSYFLWSSLPDEELRRAAAAGELQDEEQLVRQTRRMLADPKARRFATEFFGQWLGFYQFDRHRGVDPKRFPEFTDQLKRAMYDESVSFFEHIVRRDRSIDEILFADYGFMNRDLADHYRVDWKDESTTKTSLIEKLDERRGGLFGLGSILTVTSAPRRTSPVKRGDWVLRRVLGSPVPPPPADAGSIPADDDLQDGKTVRERLEAHRRDASCNNCHSRIDPFGFALENFDAVGRWRETYRDGKKISVSGTLRDGTKISGPDGLRKYVEQHKAMFHRTLCTKLVGYSFGRRESINDVELIEKMIVSAEEGCGLAKLVEQIVRSKQFRFQRR